MKKLQYLAAGIALLGLAGWGLLSLFCYFYKDMNNYLVAKIVTGVLAEYVVVNGRLPESWEPVHVFDQAHGKRILSSADLTHQHLKLRWGLAAEEFGDEQPLIWLWWKGEWTANHHLNEELRSRVQDGLERNKNSSP
jgi:hypothetical protein